jgi:hypothetical protein
VTNRNAHIETVHVASETLDEARVEAAGQLGVSVSALDLDVEQEGAHGFLGIGHKPFIVNATVTVGALRYRETKSGAFLRIVPPLTLAQAERELAALRITLAHDQLALALGSTPDVWVRVGPGAPAATAPALVVTIAEDEMSATSS